MTGQTADKCRMAFVFPGQGAQRAGMGKELFASDWQARELLTQADDLLSVPLSRLILDGPQADLNLTAHAQPAILLLSCALSRLIGSPPLALAGHSLGEYSALVCAGALDLTAALTLVHSRGVFMQEAVPPGDGAMAAVIGAGVEEIGRAAAEAGGGEAVIANYNCPGQTVISGTAKSVRAVLAALPKARGIMLPVSAPFHSPLMQPAQDRLRPLLLATTFRDPAAPVYSNVDAAPVITGEAAREKLLRQTVNPVRWEDSVRAMIADLGINLFVEIGPGNTLTGFLKRIDPAVRGAVVNGPADIENLQALLAG